MAPEVLRRFIASIRLNSVHRGTAVRRAGHTTKSWTTQDDTHRPGKPIDKGALYRILGNRTYLGEAAGATHETIKVLM